MRPWESASPTSSHSSQDALWGRGGPSAREPWPVQVQGCPCGSEPTPRFLVPLIQSPIEGRRHQARGKAIFPQEIVVILPAKLVRGFQGHP